jgi:Protein of unknown function (DUF2281)
MNIEQVVLENLKQLPEDQQQEVLNFTQFLKQKKSTFIPKSNNITNEKNRKMA